VQENKVGFAVASMLSQGGPRPDIRKGVDDCPLLRKRDLACLKELQFCSTTRICFVVKTWRL
jgi:hypothetical protein